MKLRPLVKVRNAPIWCVSCGRAVETMRRCYAIPTCYTCLPPPEPLPICPIGKLR